MTDVLLIHGAWQGGWVWDAVAPPLRDAGFAPHAVDLPGSASDVTDRASVTFADQVAFLEEFVAGLDGPFLVVAHSGGGLAASQLAENMPERVGGIVYVAGMMLPDGTKFTEIAQSCRADDPTASGIWSLLEHGEGTTSVPEAAALEIFYHDCDPAAARAAAARLTPQSNAARDVAPHVTARCFGRVPRIYIEASKDRSVVPSVQRRMRELMPGASVRRIEAGHAPMLADPVTLSAMLVDALRQLAEGAVS